MKEDIMKRLITLLLAVAMLLSLTACGNKKVVVDENKLRYKRIIISADADLDGQVSASEKLYA